MGLPSGSQPMRTEPGWLSADLPQTLEYRGEFGAELVLFLPFMTWLSQAGLLSGRRIVTYPGMRCFYDELQCQEYVERPGIRIARQASNRLGCLPEKDEHVLGRQGPCPFHVYPDLRRKFARLPLHSSLTADRRPLLIVHNKYNNEWKQGPINFFDAATLDAMFARLKASFNIVYIRHGARPSSASYSEDVDQQLRLDDHVALAKHPEVRHFEDLFAEHVSNGGQDDVNTFKNKLYSRCFHFLSVQGGGAHHFAYFSGSLMLIMHKKGHETRFAYSRGYYGFLANPAPIRAICRTEDEVIASLDLMLDSQIMGGRVHLGGEARRILPPLLPRATLATR